MTRTIILATAEPIACPECAHAFPLSEGISAQTIERYAEAYDRGFAERSKALETQLAAEAKALAKEQYETEVRSMKEALAAKGVIADAGCSRTVTRWAYEQGLAIGAMAWIRRDSTEPIDEGFLKLLS